MVEAPHARKATRLRTAKGSTESPPQNKGSLAENGPRSGLSSSRERLFSAIILPIVKIMVIRSSIFCEL